MYGNKKIICLILARGGSKGVPGKNIKLLNDKPLIEYPILQAKKSKFIDEIHVSTDCFKISKVCKNLSVKVTHRPNHLAGDSSPDIDAFKHFCLENKTEDIIVHLRATTPLIKSETVDKAIDKFLKNKCDSLRSGHETPESVLKYFLKNNEFWTPISSFDQSNKPRQLLQKTYCPNGYVDIVNPKYFMQEGNTLHGNKILSFVTEYSHEIDTSEDFNYLEYKVKNDV